MSVGTYISVFGHVGLLGLAFAGMPFDNQSDEPPIETTEVSIISSEVFEIMLNNTAPEVGAVDTTAPQPTLTIDAVPQLEVAFDAPPDQTDAVETEAPDQDILPTARPAPLVRPDLDALATPDAPIAPPVELAPSGPVEDNLRPQPRPAPRVAPTAVAPPPPDLDIGSVTRDAVQPAEEPAEEVVEEQPAEAPEEAATEIVTEPEAGSGAVATAIRPRGRPQNLAPVEDQVAEDEPVVDAPSSASQDSVAAALEQAMADAQKEADLAAAVAAQTLSVAESQGLSLAIQDCWNVGFLSSEALSTTVVVGVEFTRDGRPDASTIRLVARSGGSDASARQAFIAARSAILECGQRGFELPENIYNTWRSMELVFNPSSMRIK